MIKVRFSLMDTDCRLLRQIVLIAVYSVDVVV